MLGTLSFVLMTICLVTVGLATRLAMRGALGHRLEDMARPLGG